ncbi:MAG: hypothetical protein AAF085_15800 [Planctomycetota bacterium]
MKPILTCFVLGVCTALLLGCQREQLSQTHVQQVWEYGKPIHVNYGYTKGVSIQRYKQYVFFDRGLYQCRSTTLVSQGFSSDLTTSEIEGEWRAGGDGVPMLKVSSGAYRAITDIYPPIDQRAIELWAHQYELRQTYIAPQPQPFTVPDGREPVDLTGRTEEPTDPGPDPEADEPAGQLPINPFRLPNRHQSDPAR